MELAVALVGLLALALQWFLGRKKEKTREEKISERAEEANRKVIRVRKKLDEGKVTDVIEEIDALDRDIRLLLRMRKKGGGSKGGED